MKGLSLTRSIQPEVPISLRGDSARDLAVLTNLLSNAVKFTDLGGEVSVAVTADLESPGRLRFEVSDTGIGIEPEVRERIFRPFSQADASTSRRFGGTGLGLTIAKQLVGLMGGTIGVDSVPGVGSTFFFQLPCEVIADEDAAATGPRRGGPPWRRGAVRGGGSPIRCRRRPAGPARRGRPDQSARRRADAREGRLPGADRE